MADREDLARRAVATVHMLAKRGSTLATGVALMVAMVAIAIYLLGLAALDGGARSGWMVIGGVLVVIAVGAPLLARWRLGSVGRHADALVGEIRTLLHQGSQAQRVVVDTFEAGDPAGGGRQALVVRAQQFNDLRSLATSFGNLRRLPAAMTAVTTFPGLLAIGLIMMVVFVVLGVVFLIAWIL